MNKKIEVYRNKSLRLDNVLIKPIIKIIGSDATDDEQSDTDTPFEVLVTQMENQIRSKGANTVGPLIQYSGLEFLNDEMGFNVSLMLQADRFINNPDPGYEMEPVIKRSNCMYTRFEGQEDNLPIAYQKIQVEAYDNDICLKGSSYTIFVDGDDEGNIVADIFMEKENE